MRRIAHRNVQLVRRDDAKRRVPELPPELMTDYGDVESVGGLGRVLNRVNAPSRGEEQHDNDDDRNDSPRKLDLITPVHLRRLAVGVVAGPPTRQNRGNGQPRDARAQTPRVTA